MCMMNPKEIKSKLKEARDAIKNKDFTLAMKSCKSILKCDKENYMALVFLGISLQEVGPCDQAPFAFRKAILCNSDQALAWNGLASYYEKDDSELTSNELISVYQKLLELESDASKFSDLCNKLVLRALKINEIKKAADILKSCAENEKTSDNNRRTCWSALASLFMQIRNVPSDLNNLFEITLSAVIKERTLVTSDYYKEYLKLLYKLNKYELLFEEAIKMHNIYESTTYPLEWICKLYVDTSIEENPLSDFFEKRVNTFCDEFLKMQPDAVMGILCRAVRNFRNGNYLECRQELKRVVNLRPGSIHGWILLAECLCVLFCYNESADAACKADKLLQSLTKENLRLRQKVNRLLIETLARNPDENKLLEAIDRAEKVLAEHSNDVSILTSIVLALINLKKFNEAVTYLEKFDLNDRKLLEAKILHKKGELDAALKLLREIETESYEICFEIGTLYWDMQQYESCLMPFLQAAKLNPNNYLCFVHLGKYYDRIKDADKSRRCYQRALRLNPQCVEAGVALSNIYRQQKNWGANLELLKSVTSDGRSIHKDVRWAWLQLGLHYLDQGEFSNAIDSLRSLIRVEPNNSHYWECLADAYMARGAYTAAMKSYERAAELTSNTLYPKLQIATIQLMLGLLPEAKTAFSQILSENKCYVPALKGLAESWLCLATQQRKNQLLGACRSSAQAALDQLTMALTVRSDLSCLWKLIGDSCSLVAGLPDKYAHLTVPSSLAEARDKFQLYTLAARCYCKAIGLSETNVFLWYDLAKCYFSHACAMENSAPGQKELLDLALATCKYNVTNDPGRHNSVCWNLLGVVSAHGALRHYALAQHAFIKAVTLNRNSSTSWSNLATLYLVLGHARLANKTFSEAQRADPSYVNSWVGQGLIAEMMDHEDAMDLFRHSTQLGYHHQGAVGYAGWVCRTLIRAPPRTTIYSIHNMHAIPVACDALNWYTEHRPTDACAWNMLGILRERLNFNNSTLVAYQTALKFVDLKHRDKVLINCARVLTKLQKYNEAIDTYKMVKEASFNEKCGLALALFKAKQYEESYEAYNTTINWLADSENLQSHILVALAAMAYLFKGPDGAKILLFQSTVLKPPSQWGLFAILSLGLLHDDIPMAQLALEELQPMKDDSEIIYHYNILRALIYLRQGDKKSTIRSLLASIHCHPTSGPLWHFLSVLLLQLDATNKSKQAAKCAQTSFKLGNREMDLTKTWCMVSLASCLSQNLRAALIAAQKAVHCFPEVAETWAVLINVLKHLQMGPKWPRQEKWVKDACDFVPRYLNPNENIIKWFKCL